MLLEGSVLNGSIVLDAPADLPDGTRVRVEPAAEVPARPPIPGLEALKAQLARERDNPPPPGPTLAERLRDFVGCVADLPPDAASNVDHYLRHGLPREGAGS